MSITKVEANINNNTFSLENLMNDLYSGETRAPNNSGEYDVSVFAYDDSGNVSIADSSNTSGMVLLVKKWHVPKTNWTLNDRFNIVDYNRIKNNLLFLYEEAAKLYKNFEILDMGEDIPDTKEGHEREWNVDIFNFFELNLDIINKNIFTQDYGMSQRFFENGAFIQWNELNRIESAILSMYYILENQRIGLTKLSFRLGNKKGIKI